MTVSSHNHTLIPDGSESVADVLLVRVAPAAIASLRPDSFSRAESASEALGMLRLLRFHLLIASLDVPDMRPWELFLKAKRAQARLQCVLLDERLTLEDEQRVRQVGAGAFPSSDPAIYAALVRPSARIVHATSQQGPARAPP